MRKFAALCILPILAACGSALPAQGLFSRCYGGPMDEQAAAITSSSEGGYVAAGYTYSWGAGKSDVWLMSLDEFGAEIWRQTYGGPGQDWANSLLRTRDGNFVVAGYTRDSTAGTADAWVFQVNRFGELMWSRTFGGPGTDEALSIVQTQDGGFAVAGYSYSFSQGQSDAWLLRLDAVGQELWQRSFGGSAIEQATCLIETRDGGFLMGGYQMSPSSRDSDALLIRLDRNGKGIWRQLLRSPGSAALEALAETAEGQFLAVGWRQEPEQLPDGALYLLNRSGTLIAERRYGQEGFEKIYALAPASGGGFCLAGERRAPGGSSRLWVIRTDKQGSLLWEKSPEAHRTGKGRSILPTADKGWCIAGGTQQPEGQADIWLYKTDSRGNGPAEIGLAAPAPPLALPDSAPRCHLVSIGISQYQDSVPAIPLAAADAAATLQAWQEGAAALGFPAASRLLTDSAATRSAIREALRAAAAQAGPQDWLILYISTHGVLSAESELYLLPFDVDLAHLDETGLSAAEILALLSASPARCLLLLDACHSGQAAWNLLSLQGAQGGNLTAPAFSPAQQRFALIAAASGEEYAYESPQWSNSAFARALTEALRGAADFDADREISLIELQLYLARRVPSLTEGRQHPQMPLNLIGDVSLAGLREE